MIATEPELPVISLAHARRLKETEAKYAELEAKFAELTEELLLATTPGLMPVRATKHRCYHRGIAIDEDVRVVTCVSCGTAVDPYAVLLQYAKEERHFHYANAKLKEERASLQKAVAALKRERGNLRAAIKRAAPTGTMSLDDDVRAVAEALQETMDRKMGEGES